MNKQQFLTELDNRLVCLALKDREESMGFYAELIDEKMEAEGVSEEEAVASLGSMNEIVYAILDGYPTHKLIGKRMKDSKEHSSNKVLFIVLAVLTFPFWIGLLIAAVAVIVSIYISIWAVLVSLAIALGALLLSGVLCLIASCFISFTQGLVPALLVLGLGFFLIGACMYLYKPILSACRGLIAVIKQFFTKVKYKFFVREVAGE